jgi:hypothetical protein
MGGARASAPRQIPVSNRHEELSMPGRKTLFAAVGATLAAGAFAFAPAAHADRLAFNLSIGGPGYGVTIGDGPWYRGHAPRYVYPRSYAPAYVAPPVYAGPPVVTYAPPVVTYAPPVVTYVAPRAPYRHPPRWHGRTHYRY